MDCLIVFEDLDRWPKLSVALSKKIWCTAPVDDTTRNVNNPKAKEYNT